MVDKYSSWSFFQDSNCQLVYPVKFELSTINHSYPSKICTNLANYGGFDVSFNLLRGFNSRENFKNMVVSFNKNTQKKLETMMIMIIVL